MWTAQVLAIARANLQPFGRRVAFQHGSYAGLRSYLQTAGFPASVDGVLVDLGANSFHFDAARRGFSFSRDGPLDMRFDQSSNTPTAADVVNTGSEVELTKVRPYVFLSWLSSSIDVDDDPADLQSVRRGATRQRVR